MLTDDLSAALALLRKCWGMLSPQDPSELELINGIQAFLAAQEPRKGERRISTGGRPVGWTVLSDLPVARAGERRCTDGSQADRKPLERRKGQRRVLPCVDETSRGVRRSDWKGWDRRQPQRPQDHQPAADHFPPTGREPPGCPTPGACSCPPEVPATEQGTELVQRLHWHAEAFEAHNPDGAYDTKIADLRKAGRVIRKQAGELSAALAERDRLALLLEEAGVAINATDSAYLPFTELGKSSLIVRIRQALGGSHG